MLKKFAVLALVALSATVSASAPRADAAPDLLLPDLRQAVPGCAGGSSGELPLCTAWDVCPVVDPAAPNGRCVAPSVAKAVRLRFTSAEENVGDGPLLLYGRRDSTNQQTMTVRQALRNGADGSIPDSYAAAQRATGAFTYYEPAPAHQHWHLMNFERFALVSPQGETVVTDRKNGFCLGDRFPVHDVGRLKNVPGGSGADASLADTLRGNMCRHHEPTALEVVEGISVGAGDDYKYPVDFQWLDITHVPTGTYDLVNTVNADRTLLETNYGNNSSAVALAIAWPLGMPGADGTIPAAPVVKLLRSCPGQPRCA
ncbi:lysyl oxidase-like protein [Amycolatopsis mediterranei S699]|uniref:Lysyl oxidase-like protein n=2 Tax=Amycolatopsis mediterranei TaxID=33910 RepID=A0A0H3DDV0_AMYMU|nr:lysyl oxidase family protein [Amycolatopsis mediterranei]ADJ49120.1 lysyl oxidase-like protein [Amycolatopsis mediterranei U32]AEK46081.1 lysyl oxidase-like protein [Amycolatopsis mediterranei S699]AFO80829.1 lysyl oxidase-like protein [Amycolatopsis mediterranei S699]AGT87957.1 lysyl oxidase-like protein [Amycolatopsis mediterranei RB]KDO04101.1 lysyl oxidase [Amycolatopsis mediterranei]